MLRGNCGAAAHLAALFFNKGRCLAKMTGLPVAMDCLWTNQGHGFCLTVAASSPLLVRGCG